MATLEITCVVKDATKPAGTIAQKVPTRQDVQWPRGEDGKLKLTFVKQDGTAQTITGHTIKFGLRKLLTDASPLITKVATITNGPGGLAEVALVAADTVGLTEFARYFYDVQYTDGAPARWQVVPTSRFQVAPIVNRSGD